MARKKGENIEGLQQDYLFAEMKPAPPARVFPSEPINISGLEQETMLDVETVTSITLHACRIAASPYSVEYKDGGSEWRMSVHAPADLWDRPGLELLELRATTTASQFNRKKFQPGQWVDVTGYLQQTQELRIGETEQTVRFLSVTDIRRRKEPGSGRAPSKAVRRRQRP